MSTELKPCPFCGGGALEWNQSKGLVCCAEGDCPAYDIGCTPEAWNRRAPDTSLSQEVERLTTLHREDRQLADAHRRRAETAEAEAARLRTALIKAGRALGALLHDDVSNDFLMGVPKEAALVTARLTAERDAALKLVERLRRYCSAAARDMAGFAEVVKQNEDVFPKTLRDLLDTSEFMALAAEGREDGTLYEDELSKALERVKVLEKVSGLACKTLWPAALSHKEG